jgi:hypothetical protein
MRLFALAIFFLPTVAIAQQAAPPVQALATMLQECTAREANARVGAAMFQSDIASLTTDNESLKKQLKATQEGPTTGSR